MRSDHSSRALLFGNTALPAQVLIPVPLQYQGNTNGCGTTALAMAMSALSNKQGNSRTFTREMLDPGNREWDSFSAPTMLQRVARQQGFAAALANHLSWERIQRHLADGNLLLVVHNPAGPPRGDDSLLHYAVLDGYDTGGEGQTRRIHLSDPGLSGPRASRWLDFDTFCQTHWNQLTWRGVATGMDRYAVVVAASGPLPPDDPLPLTVQLAGAVNDGLNWLKGFLPT
jgi:hypothetical protein